MNINLTRRFFSLIFLAVLTVFPIHIFAQSEAPSSEKSIEKAMPSVVLVLAGKGDGLLDKLGSGIIIRSDGVILTAYHVVKDATQVQIRLKNGEIYDKVDLLDFDERRDVAALKISATDLPAANISSDETKIGAKIYVISNPQSSNWTVADGLLSSLRLADEIPNAGHGFRVLQFSAPVSAGSSGGLLTDENGQAIGLIVASSTSGQNLNFAIPLASVKGLADTSKKTMSFAKADTLELPQAVRPPTAIDVLNTEPKEILRNAKIFYISSASELISVKMMERALLKMPEFAKWKLSLIQEYKNADIVINVEHQLFTFDYRYTMTDRKTSIVLASGKVTVWDGGMASEKFAKQIVAKLRDIKADPENKTGGDKKSANKSR